MTKDKCRCKNPIFRPAKVWTIRGLVDGTERFCIKCGRKDPHG